MADFRGYMIGSFASSRLDRGGIPVVATTGKVSDASAAEPTVDFGINPCQWNSLPPEGIGSYYRGGREVHDIRSSREPERGYGQRHYASLLRGSDNEPPERHETNQYGYRE